MARPKRALQGQMLAFRRRADTSAAARLIAAVPCQQIWQKQGVPLFKEKRIEQTARLMGRSYVPQAPLATGQWVLYRLSNR